MIPRVVLLFELIVALPALLLVGCGSSESSPALNTGPVIFIPPVAEEDSGIAPDASLKPARPNVGSPLCNASRSFGCYPDDPTTANAQECGLAPDGGVYDASGGYDNIQLACRVAPAHRDAGPHPACAPAGTATDGMSCSASDDCEAGYECISDGTCRRYCCAGDCANRDQFCDIQQMSGSTANVPVCMPIHSCGLLDQLDAGSCPRSQTCAVVRDNGATSCVDPGPRRAGAECDTDQCARGLVCLGTSGDRHCYVLCHTALGATECASTTKQMCMGGLPLFPVPGLGICE
jgi:hypothetical protein